MDRTVHLYCTPFDAIRVKALVEILARSELTPRLVTEPTRSVRTPAILLVTNRSAASRWFWRLLETSMQLPASQVRVAVLDDVPLPPLDRPVINLSGWPSRSSDQALDAILSWLNPPSPPTRTDDSAASAASNTGRRVRDRWVGSVLLAGLLIGLWGLGSMSSKSDAGSAPSADMSDAGPRGGMEQLSGTHGASGTHTPIEELDRKLNRTLASSDRVSNGTHTPISVLDGAGLARGVVAGVPIDRAHRVSGTHTSTGPSASRHIFRSKNVVSGTHTPSSLFSPSNRSFGRRYIEGCAHQPGGSGMRAQSDTHARSDTHVSVPAEVLTWTYHLAPIDRLRLPLADCVAAALWPS